MGGGSWSGRSSIVKSGGTLLPRLELPICTIAFFFEAFLGAMVGAGGGGGGGGGRDGGMGMSGAGTAGPAGFLDGERDRPFRRLVRTVSPASCAATELELEPPMATAPAPGGGGGGLLLDLAGTSTIVPPRFWDRFCKILLRPTPLLCICRTAFPTVMPRFCRYDSWALCRWSLLLCPCCINCINAGSVPDDDGTDGCKLAW